MITNVSDQIFLQGQILLKYVLLCLAYQFPLRIVNHFLNLRVFNQYFTVLSLSLILLWGCRANDVLFNSYRWCTTISVDVYVIINSVYVSCISLL